MLHCCTRLAQSGKVEEKFMCTSRRHVGEWPLILGLGIRRFELTARSLYLSEESPLYELKRGLVEPQSRTDRFGEEMMLLPLPRIER